MKVQTETRLKNTIRALVYITVFFFVYIEFVVQEAIITARKVPVSKSSQAWKLYDFKECTSWEMYKRAQGLKPCAR